MKITPVCPEISPARLPCRPLPFLFVLLLLFLPPASSAQEKPEPDHVLKFATIAPENTVWGDIINQFSREVEAESQGRVKLIWYFGGVMGDEPDIIRKIKLDQLQGSALLSVGLSKLAPEVNVFSLPYLFENYQEIDCVFDHSWPLIEKVFAQRGVFAFGRVDIGFSVIFSKNHLKNAADFQKTRYWIWEGMEIDKSIAQMLGVQNLVPLSLPEVFPSLKSGMLDTVFATYYTSIALQWNTQVGFMTNPSQYKGQYSPGMLIMKKETYDAMSPDLQEIMKKSFNRYLPDLRESLRRDEEKSLNILRKRGIQFMDLDPKFLEEIRVRSRDIYRDWENVFFPSWFLQGILTARNQCRAEAGE